MTSHNGPSVQLSAYEDIAAIRDRLTRVGGTGVAQRTVDRILDGIDLLGPSPFLGPLHHDEVLARLGYRKLVLGKYVVVYRVVDGYAVVLRVFYGSIDYARHIDA